MLKFKREKLKLWEGRYYCNGRVAILSDTEDGEPYCDITVNIPDEPLEENEVVIDQLCDSIGLLALLIEKGIMTPHHRTVRSGFCDFKICRYDPSKM